MILLKAGRAAALLAALIMTAGTTNAGIQELVRETQNNMTKDGQASMIWWIPEEFWTESLKNSGAALPEPVRQQILAMMSGYNIIAALHGSVSGTGLNNVHPKAEIQKNISVEYNGKALEPLAAEQLDPATLVVLAQLKPSIAGMLGQLGQAIEFLVYPAKADGVRIIDPLKEGELKITFYENVTRFRMPLASLLPPSVDAKTGEQFPGNYRFNPFTGEKLSTR